MNVLKCSNYNQMSELAATMMFSTLINKPDALFCIATGGSPTGCYANFVKMVKDNNISTSQMQIVKLDEWAGLSKDNPATCEYYIEEKILKPLDIPASRYISFDPLCKDVSEECNRVEEALHEAGGIDLCLLGIGRNGHLGLNEPGESLKPYAHRAELQPITRTHAMLMRNHESVSAGITLGIADIMNSRQVLLLIAGAEKEKP